MPKVSVIIPAFNCAKTLPRTLQSVLSQTFQDFEVIIVDDGSTDGTESVVAEFTQRDWRISYHVIPHSGGAARPKNEGLSMAKGEYIATLDADDEWLPLKLDHQVEFLESSPKDVGCISCHALHIDEVNDQVYEYRIPRVKDVLSQVLGRDYMGSGSGFVYRREVFDQVGGFDERLKSGQDSEMRIRLAQHFAFDFVDEVLFRYYFHSKNISNRLSIETRQADVDYIFQKWKSLYLTQPKALSEKYRADGTRLALAGRQRDARRKFVLALNKNPANAKVYFYMLASLLGAAGYRRLSYLKARGEAWLRSRSQASPTE